MITARTVYDADGIPASLIVTDKHYDLPYDALLRSAEPINWSVILPKRFTDMIPLDTGDDGWTRCIEHGKYAWFRHRTPLKFWKVLGDNAYSINYKLDPDAPKQMIDSYVTLDTGYIWVMKAGSGVRVRTQKLWAINGVSSVLASWAAPWLGWAEVTEEFFHAAVKVPVNKLMPFVPSIST